MTSIAYKDGVLAADSVQWFGGYRLAPDVDKIERVGESLYACAGGLPTIIRFLDWRRDTADIGKKPAPVDEKEFDCIELSDGKVWRWSEKFERYPIYEPFVAIGAHWEFMLGAMAHGATAEEAVKLAIKCGDSAAGEITVARL